MRTPVTIITGYLGAGKTTLLKRIISEIEKRIAIIMNEFGEINIDSKIIKQKNFEMAELLGGCVCCSLTGEFEAAIKEIIEKVKPEAIIVETTGVAEPDAMIVDIQDNMPELKLDSIVTIVDADAMKRFPSIGHTGKVQIENANVILVNKVDLVSKDDLAEIKEKIKSINKGAIQIETEKCDVSLDVLFGFDFVRDLTVHEHRHPEKIESFVFKTDKKLNKEKFEKFLNELPDKFYRLKGFVRFEKESRLLNFVAGRYELEDVEDQNTELVFIGKSILKEKDKIIKELKSFNIL